jgi:hypothetical protein
VSTSSRGKAGNQPPFLPHSSCLIRCNLRTGLWIEAMDRSPGPAKPGVQPLISPHFLGSSIMRMPSLASATCSWLHSRSIYIKCQCTTRWWVRGPSMDSILSMVIAWYRSLSFFVDNSLNMRRNTAFDCIRLEELEEHPDDLR